MKNLAIILIVILFAATVTAAVSIMPANQEEGRIRYADLTIGINIPPEDIAKSLKAGKEATLVITYKGGSFTGTIETISKIENTSGGNRDTIFLFYRCWGIGEQEKIEELVSKIRVKNMEVCNRKKFSWGEIYSMRKK